MQKKVNTDIIEGQMENITTVLELQVNNHPGVMSHICGLFSRRAYNVEGIVCVPEGTGETSRMWLEINEEDKLEQIVKQVQKQPDVLNVVRHDHGHRIFEDIGCRR